MKSSGNLLVDLVEIVLARYVKVARKMTYQLTSTNKKHNTSEA